MKREREGGGARGLKDGKTEWHDHKRDIDHFLHLMFTKLPVIDKREQSGDSASPAYGIVPQAALESFSAFDKV